MPTLGTGDIASVLPQRDDLLFFASGVSNSKETRESEYEREINLLLDQDRASHIVYFSSLAIFTSTSRYILHKYQMEFLVKSEFPNHCIVRLGNITWGTNPHTLINYLRTHPDAKIRDEYRHIVDKREFLYWINLIPTWNCEMNITGKWLEVREVARDYAGFPVEQL